MQPNQEGQKQLSEASSSIYSMDSSLLCSKLSLFESHKNTQSENQNSSSSTASIENKRNEKPEKVKSEVSSKFSTLTQSIEKLRKQDISQVNDDYSIPLGFTLGFVGGFNKKPMLFSDTKLKMAERFFDDNEYFSNNENPFRIQQPLDMEDPFKNMDDFVPTFKFGHSSKIVEIDPNLQQKVRQFFDSDNTRQVQNGSKKTMRMPPIQPRLNELNTVPVGNKARRRKCTLNHLNSSRKETSKMNSKLLISPIFRPQPDLIYQQVKLQDMRQDYQHIEGYEQFTEFSHSNTNCSVISCFFCDIQWKRPKILKKEIISTIIQRTKCDIPDEHIEAYYSAICFKLFRRERECPQLINKRLNPSNIAFELYKKVTKYPSGYLGFLIQCLRIPCGQLMNVIIREIEFCQRINGYFLKLSDGWTSTWALIKDNNLLYNYTCIMKVGLKIQIASWKQSPISNILTFCQRAVQLNEQQGKCIQFFYNGSRILPGNSKLGKPRLGAYLYRPLSKCRSNGGNIPLVQGIVIRMFEEKVQHFKTVSYLHYVQLLTFEKTVHYIKFTLPTQVSLPEYFRLYYSYHFGNIKIEENGILLFHDKSSKFQQLNNQTKSNQVRQFLLNRLFKKDSQLQPGKLHDVYCKDGIFEHQKLIIKVEPKRSGKILYQQYQLSQTNGQFCFTRHKFSNPIERLPKVYTEIIVQSID